MNPTVTVRSQVVQQDGRAGSEGSHCRHFAERHVTLVISIGKTAVQPNQGDENILMVIIDAQSIKKNRRVEVKK